MEDIFIVQLKAKRREENMHKTRKRPTIVPLIQTNHTQEKKLEREVKDVLL